MGCWSRVADRREPVVRGGEHKGVLDGEE